MRMNKLSFLGILGLFCCAPASASTITELDVLVTAPSIVAGGRVP
jgi:hypothetical protein